MAPCRDFQIFSQNFPLLLPARAWVVCMYKNFASLFVAKATPPHSLSKPSELQSEEQSSISKSTCERTCSMTYTVSPLIELDVSSKLRQITKLAYHLLQIWSFHKLISNKRAAIWRAIIHLKKYIWSYMQVEFRDTDLKVALKLNTWRKFSFVLISLWMATKAHA